MCHIAKKRVFPFVQFLFRKDFLIFILNLFFVGQSFTQSDDIYFDRLSVKDGLSHSTVFNIVQDTTGFIWIATQEGLNKYDGYEFTLYRHIPTDKNSISSNWINKLFVDSNGNLWIITLDGKLNRYIFEKDNFKRYKVEQIDSVSDKVNFITIAEDTKKNLWIGTTSGRLYKYSKSTDNFHASPTIFDYDIHLHSMFFDGTGNLWLGTWKGLILIKNFALSPTKPETKKFDTGIVFQITQDEQNNIWIASVGKGLFVFDTNGKLLHNYQHNPRDPFSLSSNRVSSIFFDSSDRLWIGTIDKGINILEKGGIQFKRYQNNPVENWSIGKGAVFSFFEDKNKIIWISTYGGGISKYDENKQFFKCISYIPGDPESLPPYSVISICEDSKGGLWVGTDGGGLSYKPSNQNKFNHFFQNAKETGSNTITAIEEDYKGNIWVGFDQSTPIYIYNTKRKKFEKIEKLKFGFGCVSVLFEDHARDIWIGTCSNGLYRLIRGEDKIIPYNINSKKLNDDVILSLFEDRQNNIWIGTMHGGLSKISADRKTVETFLHDPQNNKSISSNSIWCITEDKNGIIWIGTWGGGLNKLLTDKNEFETFTVENGLPDNTIYAALPDFAGFLWLSTNRGISKFNTKNYNIINFTQSDGLRNLEFNGGAFCIGKSGKYYFGGTEGITYFYPSTVKKKFFIPSITFTKFKVFDKPLKLTEILKTNSVTLSYNQNFFSIEFAVLDYSSPENNKYSYKLEGIDKDWVNSGNRRTASYTNISPGEYLFRIKGANSNGIWTQKEAKLLIEILPPFWLTWWFKLIIIAAILFTLWEIHNYRLNKALEIERTRNKIARDLHDEVSATITGIVYFANAVLNEIGKTTTQNVKNLLSLIIESATEAGEMMSDIIWSINPENDNWEIVLPKFRRYVSDLCESKNISYKIEIPEKVTVKEITMEQRRNFWLIFKEMVTNAIKHSNCTELKVKIEFRKNELQLIVQDNGKGFDPNKQTDRNGIKNIHNRAKEIGGTVLLNTEINKGTEWQLNFPL